MVLECDLFTFSLLDRFYICGCVHGIKIRDFVS